MFVLVLQWDHWVGGALGGHGSDASMLLQHPPSPLSFFGSPMLVFLLLSLAGWVFFFCWRFPWAERAPASSNVLNRRACLAHVRRIIRRPWDFSGCFRCPCCCHHGWAHRPHDPEAYFGKLMGGAARGKAAPERNRGKAARRCGLRLETPALPGWSLREGGLCSCTCQPWGNPWGCGTHLHLHLFQRGSGIARPILGEAPPPQLLTHRCRSKVRRLSSSVWRRIGRGMGSPRLERGVITSP